MTIDPSTHSCILLSITSLEAALQVCHRAQWRRLRRLQGTGSLVLVHPPTEDALLRISGGSE